MGISLTPICPADRGKNWILLWGEETSFFFNESGIPTLEKCRNPQKTLIYEFSDLPKHPMFPSSAI
jgi:hypothetical protein